MSVCPCCSPPWAYGVPPIVDPSCQGSPASYYVPNYFVRLKTLNYWRHMIGLGQFAMNHADWGWNSFLSTFTNSRPGNCGSPYDRTEWCNSRHGTPLNRSDFNLLHNVTTPQTGGASLPLGLDIDVVATENDDSNPQNITATWDGAWSSPRWMISDPTTIDGVNLQGYIALSDSAQAGEGRKLRWFYGNPGDNPNPSDEDQDGSSGSQFYDPSSIDYCVRTASYAFGGSGPKATVTWSRQVPRKFWWNPGGGGALVDVSSESYSGFTYWIPSGGTADGDSSAGFAAGTKVDQIYNVGSDRDYRSSFLSPATGTVAVDWWYDHYPELDVTLPDMSWAGGTTGETWTDTWTDWVYELTSGTDYTPQTGWTWINQIYFYDTGSGLANWEVVLELNLYENNQSASEKTWTFTSAVDFSTDFEDKIQLTRDFTLSYDSGHPDDDGIGTGAFVFPATFYGAPADYSVTVPASFAVNFQYAFLR